MNSKKPNSRESYKIDSYVNQHWNAQSIWHALVKKDVDNVAQQILNIKDICWEQQLGWRT